LTLLAAVEAERDFQLAQVRAAAQEGRLDTALDELGRAAELRNGPDVRRLQACLHLLAGDFAAAFVEFQTVPAD
jgi:hypothetical protein